MAGRLQNDIMGNVTKEPDATSTSAINRTVLGKLLSQIRLKVHYANRESFLPEWRVGASG